MESLSNLDEKFSRLIEAFRPNTAVTLPDQSTGSRKAFGSNGLKVDGKIFAMLTSKGFVVKIPARRVNELVAEGEGQQFDPGHGRLMKEWLQLNPESNMDWLLLATEAMNFVRSK